MILPVGKISTDPKLQSRVSINADVVADYLAKLLEDQSFDFPSVVVFFDGETYWLADGYHRLAAYAGVTRPGIPADVRPGTKRDALRYSLGANSAHGLPRSSEDKRKAVIIALKDEEWGKWTNSEISRLCAVSPPTVASHRASLKEFLSDNGKSSDERTYVNKHGQTATMNTGNIGRKKGRKKKQPVSSKSKKQAEREPEQAEESTLFDADPLESIKAAYLALDADQQEAFRAWLSKQESKAS